MLPESENKAIEGMSYLLGFEHEVSSQVQMDGCNYI